MLIRDGSFFSFFFCYLGRTGEERRGAAGARVADPAAAGRAAHRRDEAGAAEEDPPDADSGAAAAATAAAAAAPAAAHEPDHHAGHRRQIGYRFPFVFGPGCFLVLLTWSVFSTSSGRFVGVDEAAAAGALDGRRRHRDAGPLEIRQRFIRQEPRYLFSSKV